MKLTTNKQRKTSRNVLCFIVISVIYRELISGFTRCISEFCAPLWDFTQRQTVVPYRRFGTTYRPIFINSTCHVNWVWWKYVHVEASSRLMPSVRRRMSSVKVHVETSWRLLASDTEWVRWKYVHVEASSRLMPSIWHRVSSVKVCTCFKLLTISATCQTPSEFGESMYILKPLED
jgi:hypothetical protein